MVFYSTEIKPAISGNNSNESNVTTMYRCPGLIFYWKFKFLNDSGFAERTTTDYTFDTV